MTEHTILVAFVVEHDTREQAQAALMERIGLGASTPVNPTEPTRVNSWWIAEDDRIDGSDNDSAVYVRPGKQQSAWEHLRDADEPLTPMNNDPSRYLGGNRFS